jgi:hypothetical protein
VATECRQTCHDGEITAEEAGGPHHGFRRGFASLDSVRAVGTHEVIFQIATQLILLPVAPDGKIRMDKNLFKIFVDDPNSCDAATSRS